MFRFLWSASSHGEPESPADQDLLRFAPEKVVQAIRYHLLDSHAARTLTRQSCEETVERLSRRHQWPSIRRDQWAAMTNTQRLHWLLDQSHSAVIFQTDDVAVLLETR